MASYKLTRHCWRLLFVIIPVAFHFPSVFAQRLNTTIIPKFYSLNDGLSDRLVTNIVSSKDGFIWMATSNGLNKFDGYEFVVFNDDFNNPNHISGNNIDRLFLSKGGKLLITYRNKLSFFDLLDPYTHRTLKVDLSSPESGIKGIVRQVTTNQNGEILVLTTNQEGAFLHLYENKNHFKVLFELKETRKKQSVAASILQLQNGKYLLNDSEKGLRLVNVRGNVIKTFREEDFISNLIIERHSESPNFIYKDQKGRVWLSSTRHPGVFLFSEKDNKFKLYEKLPPAHHYSYVWEDKQGNLLFAQTTGDGNYPDVQNLYCLDSNDILVDFSHLVALGPRIITMYSEDFYKTIVMAIDSGVKIAQNSFYQIKTFLAAPIGNDQRSHVMRGIDGNKEKVYFLEEGGQWYALDLKTDQLDTLQLIDSQTGNPVESDCALDIHLDKEGFLWGISCNNLEEGQLHKYDPTTGLAETFRFNQKFRAFTQSRDGTFWILSESSNNENNHLVSFHPNICEFKIYKDNKGKNPLQDYTPYYITESRDGLLWLGTGNGLIKVDPQKKIPSKIYQTQPNKEGEGLRSNTIYLIYEDSKSLLWIGTTNGLSVLHPKTEEIYTISQRQGLVNNTVCGIVPDENGNFWISTFNGLSYYDCENEQFHNYFQVDGLSSNEFNRFSFYRDMKGRYYFGTVNGINAFYSKDMLTGETIPKISVTKIVRYNTKKDSVFVQYDHLNPIEPIKISPYDAYFQLHFMLPKYSDPDRNQFSIWLENYEKGWVYLGNTSSIRYNSLPPGNYTLHIKGADANGNWSSEILKIPITVRKIFYRTAWFWLLVIATLSGIAYLAFRYQWEQKLQVERFRTKLSSDLHDELSGLLSGIAMQTDMLQMMNQDETTKSRLRHIGEVSRKAMSKMSDVIWSIDSRKDKMGDLLLRMREHADDILLPLNVQYTFEERKIDPSHKIPPTIRQELYLIFKESINNIAKHSNANQVNILLQNMDGHFLMEIEDNGKGIAKPHNGKTTHHSGQGLSNIKMRARRINAKVEILKNQGYTISLKMRRFA
ncbi:MAG: two-component regulator propeller domain-containing protein [Saprospiraceae bacterium]|nr:two-component regulator propeller domain-containing protein [Saprospiraceae bacterium]